jgi:NADH:ubiquinone reductase (non-electrogenic)
MQFSLRNFPPTSDFFNPETKIAFAASDDEKNKPEFDKKKKRIVILGSGWGAVSLLKEIGDEYEVIVVSPRNYFLFTPLLTGVTVGTNDERSVIEPIRTFCKRSGKSDIVFYEAKCTSIDPESHKIVCEDVSPLKGSVEKFELTYDYLGAEKLAILTFLDALD